MESELRGLVFLFACIICFPLVSAFWSGMHLSRAYALYKSTEIADESLNILQNLLLGMEPVDENGPERAIYRMTRISGDEKLEDSIDNLDPQILKYKNQIELFSKKPRKALANKKRDKSSNIVGTMSIVTELAINLQLRAVVPLAANGRGGNPKQKERTLKFEGPMGTINLVTNFLPPDMRMRPFLIPGAYKDGLLSASKRIKTAAQTLPFEAQEYFGHIDKLFISYDPEDMLVRMWYSTLAAFFSTKATISEFVKRAKPFKLARIDRKGLLTIYLYNSCERYKEEYEKKVGAAIELAGSGVYLPKENEILLWSDEREDTRMLASNLLELYAMHLSSMDVPLSDSQVDADIIRTSIQSPQDRVSSVMFHELAHWAINALFSDAPWLRTGLPPAFEEGLALMFDDEALRIITGLKKYSNVSTIQPLFRDQPCASEQKEINWSCYWYDSINHKTRSPGELALLNRNELHRGSNEDVISNYADCWALVYFFGEPVIVEALAQSTSVQRVIENDTIFSTPWKVIQNDIKNRTSRIPDFIVNRFNDCRQ